MLRALSALVSLYLFWILLSGFFTPFLLASGLGCCVAIVLIARRLGILDHEGHPIEFLWRAISSYWPWLAWEIAKSAWDVTKRILAPSLPISPALVEFVPTQRTGVGLVLHANSITLTPGTISVEAEEGRFLVHALTQEGAAGLVGSEMDRRCTAIEGS
jgi:multicomponent Na+:H+ antiporter subunit E